MGALWLVQIHRMFISFQHLRNLQNFFSVWSVLFVDLFCRICLNPIIQTVSVIIVSFNEISFTKCSTSDWCPPLWPPPTTTPLPGSYVNSTFYVTLVMQGWTVFKAYVVLLLVLSQEAHLQKCTETWGQWLAERRRDFEGKGAKWYQRARMKSDPQWGIVRVDECTTNTEFFIWCCAVTDTCWYLWRIKDRIKPRQIENFLLEWVISSCKTRINNKNHT